MDGRWDERVIIKDGQKVGTIHEARYQAYRRPMLRFDDEPVPVADMLPFAEGMAGAGYVMPERKRR